MSLAWWLTVTALAAFAITCIAVAVIQTCRASRYVYGENAPIPKIGQRATRAPDGDSKRRLA